MGQRNLTERGNPILEVFKSLILIKKRNWFNFQSFKFFLLIFKNYSYFFNTILIKKDIISYQKAWNFTNYTLFSIQKAKSILTNLTTYV